MVSKADILHRLKLASNSTSDADLARFLGVAPATLSNWKARGSLDYDLVFSKCEQLNLDWLLTGRGAMSRAPEQPPLQVQEKFPLLTDQLKESQRIPLYNLEATAGLVALFEDVNTAPLSYISLPDLPACDGAVHVRGDSMYPLLKSGDIVLYKRVHDLEYGIFWGEMYLVSFNVDGDEYITIKYIQKSQREGFVKLVSHNPHHDPKEIPVTMIRALALVKASVRYNAIR